MGLALLISGALTRVLAEDVIPLRLVALVDKDDRGDSIAFPNVIFYDYWSSETYLLNSKQRIIVYDQKFFPVASFGTGRGLKRALGLTVDRHGIIYVCLDADGPNNRKARLLLLNQAFFITKEIVYADIPELVDFVATRVAVAESGLIYLSGHLPAKPAEYVVVYSREGEFLRLLEPPAKDVWRPAPKKPAGGKVREVSSEVAAPEGEESGDERIPAGLKPKSSSPEGDAEENKGQMGPAMITDVKIDRQGRIYLLSREASQIYVLNAKEEFLFKFGEKGGVPGKLSNPVSLAIDLERRVIYVCDYMRHTILCYDYDSGKFIFEFGGRGAGPLWFNFPNNVEVDQRGMVVVSDLFNQRLQVIDPNVGERRPITGGLGGLAAASRPTASEAGSPVVSQPESVASDAVVASSLTAPPPAQAPLAAPSGGHSPLGVLPLRLPSLMAGVATEPVRIPLAAGNKPMARSTPLPVRELLPARLKKKAAPGNPSLQLVTVAPLRTPAMIPRPDAVRFTKERPGVPVSRRVTGEPSGILAKFRSMPAAVGVYGPVAALVGVGSWLLYTNR